MTLDVNAVTVGLQVDAAVGIAAEVAVGFAFEYPQVMRNLGFADALAGREHRATKVPTCGYSDASIGLGIAFGASAGIEVGFWNAGIDDLAGNFYAVELELGAGYGGGIGLYWERRDDLSVGDFLGFSVVVGPAGEIDFRAVLGETKTFLESLPTTAAGVVIGG